MPVIKNFILLIVLVQTLVYLSGTINSSTIETSTSCTRTKQDTNCINCHNNKKYTQAIHKTQPCYKCHIKINSITQISNNVCIECHKEAQIDNYPKISNFIKHYCLDCHDNLNSLPVGINWGHKIAGSQVNKYCSSCHRLHQEGKPRAKLLRQSINSLCISCHRSEIRNFLTVSSHINQLTQNNCTICHKPHYNIQIPPQRWQMQRGNIDSLLDYSIFRQQELCTKCHSILTLTSNYSSRFKNGMFSNLHDRHLKVGATCLECHNPHGSIYPRLIRTEVEVKPDFPLGNQFNYISIGSGGICTVKCHDESHQGVIYRWSN